MHFLLLGTNKLDSYEWMVLKKKKFCCCCCCCCFCCCCCCCGHLSDLFPWNCELLQNEKVNCIWHTYKAVVIWPQQTSLLNLVTKTNWFEYRKYNKVKLHFLSGKNENLFHRKKGGTSTYEKVNPKVSQVIESGTGRKIGWKIYRQK